MILSVVLVRLQLLYIFSTFLNDYIQCQIKFIYIQRNRIYFYRNRILAFNNFQRLLFHPTTFRNEKQRFFFNNVKNFRQNFLLSQSKNNLYCISRSCYCRENAQTCRYWQKLQYYQKTMNMLYAKFNEQINKCFNQQQYQQHLQHYENNIIKIIVKQYHNVQYPIKSSINYISFRIFFTMLRRHLNPLNRKILQSRQKNFRLDCTNVQKSQLPSYNSLKDKYLKYYVIRAVKCKVVKNKSNHGVVNKTQFNQFLKKKREMLMEQEIKKQYSSNQSIRKNQEQMINANIVKPSQKNKRQSQYEIELCNNMENKENIRNEPKQGSNQNIEQIESNKQFREQQIV